jgi:hypothetical protein
MGLEENNASDQELRLSLAQVTPLYEKFLLPFVLELDKLLPTDGQTLDQLTTYLYSPNQLNEPDFNLDPLAEKCLPLARYNKDKIEILIKQLLDEKNGLFCGIGKLITPHTGSESALGADVMVPAVIAFFNALNNEAKSSCSKIFCLLLIFASFFYKDIHSYKYLITTYETGLAYSMLNSKPELIPIFLLRDTEFNKLIRLRLEACQQAANNKVDYWQQCLQGEALSLSNLEKSSTNTDLEQGYLLVKLKQWGIFQLYRLQDYQSNALSLSEPDKNTINQAWNSKPLILQWVVTIYFSLLRLFRRISGIFQQRDTDMDLQAACSTYCPTI